MSQNVYDWDFSRECLQFSLSVTVLDKVATCFRARTQMFLWSSVIFCMRSITVGYSIFLCFLASVIVTNSLSIKCRRKQQFFAWCPKCELLGIYVSNICNSRSQLLFLTRLQCVSEPELRRFCRVL